MAGGRGKSGALLGNLTIPFEHMKTLLNLPESSLVSVVGYLLSPRDVNDLAEVGLVSKYFHVLLAKSISDCLNALVKRHHLFVKV